MLKSNLGRISDHASLPLRALALAAATFAFTPAHAVVTPDTTVTAGNGLTCASDRGAASCTAKEFTVTVAATQGSNITSCFSGNATQPPEEVVIDVIATITSKSTDRDDIALFIGENGNAPDLATPAGDHCSVATFPMQADPPSTSTAWFNDNGGATNTCGDYHGGGLVTNNLIHNVKVACIADQATGFLAIPYALTYVQNGNNACSGPTDVLPGTGSKCVGGGTPVQGVVVLHNANPTCNKSLVFDAPNLTVTSTITISNSGPDFADGTSFDDPVPSPITVISAVCQNALGGAVCPAGPLTVTGNDVSGAIPTLPVGGSVDIVITGSVPDGSTAQITNTATLSVPANIVPPANWVSTCSNNPVTLPVRLQSFDVR
jgi:uncharacterized repeat protein (TIGR01451 family)